MNSLTCVPLQGVRIYHIFSENRQLSTSFSKDSVPPQRTAVRIAEVSEGLAGQRLDNFLLRELKGVPRGVVYKLCRKGQVRVNGGRAKPDRRLEAGDKVRIPPVEVRDERAPVRVPDGIVEQLESAIFFEDEDLILLNKPVGIAVHKGTGVNFGVVEAFRQSREAGAGLDLAHRLDRETSGCLLIGKHAGAVRALQALWKARAVEKHYSALVCGHWPEGEKAIVSHMKKNQLRGGERVSSSGEGGKRAVSHVRLLKRGFACSQIEVHIETGRTHQIRVHTQEAGHPVLGDDKYGDRSLNKAFERAGHKRMFLHAQQLVLDWKGARNWRIPAPAHWSEVLKVKI